MTDKFDNADYYGWAGSETLEHETPGALIAAFLGDMLYKPFEEMAEDRFAAVLDGIKRAAPLTVHAYVRATVDLSKYGIDLAERLAELLDEDEEMAHPDGDISVLEDVDMKALAEAIGKAVAPFSAQAKPWHCNDAGKRTYSADEIEAMMRKEHPAWFAEAALVAGKAEGGK